MNPQADDKLVETLKAMDAKESAVMTLDPTTKEGREGLRKLEQAATKGEWYVMAGGFTAPENKYPTVYAPGDELGFVCKCADPFGILEKPRNLQNANLIAAARNALPALLAMAERVRELEDAVQHALQVLAEYGHIQPWYQGQGRDKTIMASLTGALAVVAAAAAKGKEAPDGR